MSLLHDLEPLLPSEADSAARRDALVRELEAATAAEPRSFDRPRRRVVRRASVLAAAAALGLAAAFVVPRVVGGADAIDEARAAIVVPRDGILHTVVRYRHGAGISMGTYFDGAPEGGGKIVGRTTGDSERWAATDPWRQRWIEFLRKPDGGEATIQSAIGPTEQSYRTSWEARTDVEPISKRQWREMENIRRRLGTDLRGAAEGFNEDPVTAIEALLRSGRLRDDGSADLGGRDVRRLVGREPGFRDQGGTWSPGVEFVYFVDDETYAPVEVRSTQILPARPNDPEPAARKERRITERWTFETFERLPLNAQTERLLEIDPTR